MSVGTCTPPHPEDDTWSTASSDSMGSVNDLEPQTLDFSDGKYEKVNKNVFNIIQFNVNSLLNKIDQIEAQIKELNADIIFLTETWMKAWQSLTIRYQASTWSISIGPDPEVEFLS